jgi:hypothetical protein
MSKYPYRMLLLGGLAMGLVLSGVLLQMDSVGAMRHKPQQGPSRTPNPQSDGPITVDGVILASLKSTAILAPMAPRLGPSAPSNLRALALSRTHIRLDWDVEGNEDLFYIEQSLTGTSDWSLIGTRSAPPMSVTNLDCGTTYYYRVRSLTGGHYSPYSNIANATTFACPTNTPTPIPEFFSYLPVVVRRSLDDFLSPRAVR